MKKWSERITSRPAGEFADNVLADIMTVSFQGYVVPQVLNAQMFNARFMRESLDKTASWVIEDYGQPVGLILIARRGWTARVAALAIAPSHRHCGLGRIVLSQCIDRLTKLGDHRLTLEVIETNEPAVRLYESLGFVAQRRLIGYRRRANGERPSVVQNFLDADPQFIARRLAADGTIDLPWQLAPETLAAMSAPARGLALNGAAFAIVGPSPQASDLTLRTLYVVRNLRRSGFGSAMIKALSSLYPSHDLVVPATLPEEQYPAFWLRAGFQRTGISQVEMVRSLVN